jgi:glyoxylase-like metal-dependent hydrolase (beta-lactamase superfamily II)
MSRPDPLTLQTDITALAPGVRRIVAPNPSLMTGPGTNSYLFGERDIAVLDPGPAIPAHVQNIVDKSNGYIKWVVVTHTHPDHSPAAVMLAESTGAELLGMPAPDGPHQDHTFRPDRTLGDGEVLETTEFCLQAVHTPGHASNHICLRHDTLDWLFTGDHVIEGSTVVIDPPDGDMKHYLESLRRVQALHCRAIAPGHGGIIENPATVIDWIITHRLQREAKVATAMAAHPQLTARQLVPHVYQDVDPKLYDWAERSLLAHALKLEAEGSARSNNGRWSILDMTPKVE